MRPARRFAALLLACALSGLAACEGGPQNRRILLDQLANREAYWAANGSANYTLAMTRDCLCNDDALRWQVQLEVVNNEAVSGFDTFTGVALTPAELDEQYTIPDLFALVRDALNRGAPTINIEYNPDFGFVQSLYIDYNPRRSTDDIVINVESYTPNSGS